MSRLLILVPVLTALAACNNQGREAYYQSRATPTSSADAYGIAAQLSWEDNRRSIYELPAMPPDRKGEAPPRVDCEKPGPKFKPIPMVAWGGKPIRATGQSDLTAIAGTKMDRPAGDDVGLRQHPMISGRGTLYRPGISQPPYLVKPGTGDSRPRSITGAGTDVDPAQPMVNFHDRNNPYCDVDPTRGVMPVDPPPIPERPSGVDTTPLDAPGPRK